MNLEGRKIPNPKGRNRSFRIVITGMLTLFGLAVYPAIVSPILNPEPWKRFREEHPLKPGK